MADRSFHDEIADILVDCYTEDEERMAWEVAFQDGVQVPFKATILGMPVEVHEFRAGPVSNVQCLIIRDGTQRWVGVEDLDEKDLPADFKHVLNLYRGWASGNY